jgi:3-dehydroquinate synthase
LHELVPDVPLRHGHAISIDMAYSATLARKRGLLSEEEHKRLLNLFSKAGLSMDHHQFDESILDKGTKAILKTRDGLLRAAVPNPLGSCVFLNDVSQDELFEALRMHKEIMKEYPRNGEGLEAFVDASDTGYTMNPHEKVENTEGDSALLRKIDVLNEPAIVSNGVNGYVNGAKKPAVKGHVNGVNGVNGVSKSHAHTNGINGVAVNGHTVTNGVAHDRH